uniref:Uncharacterized protein n=1 Tax=Arundo donax TaxID=35708 RepID=A0A0A8YTQ4_ARUDO
MQKTGVPAGSSWTIANCSIRWTSTVMLSCRSNPVCQMTEESVPSEPMYGM